MCAMNGTQTLPLPNPGDWGTWTHVQTVLLVSRQTLVRMTEDGRLTLYRIGGGAPVFWMPEVRELAAARERAGIKERNRA